MPYPNEHSCRIVDPGKFQKDSFRRITQGKLSIIIGKLIGKTKTTTQAFRYPTSSWSADAARKHCQEQGGTFEAARKEVKGLEQIHFVDLLGAELAEGQTSEIEVVRIGSWKHPEYGDFEITEEDLDNIVKNFSDGVRAVKASDGSLQLVVDYQHGSTETDPEKAKAAGWIRKLWRVGDAVKAVVAWTKKAAEFITNGEYSYISPEIAFSYKDKKSGEDVGPTLLAAALTNRPFLEELEPVVLSEKLSGFIFATKTDDGVEYGSDAYLYVPDPDKPSTWKLRVKEVVGGQKKVTRAQLGRAAAALGPGFRGQKVELPAGEKAKVVKKLISLYHKLGVEDDEIPKYLKAMEKEVTDMEEKEIRKLLGIDEKANIEESIKGLVAKADDKKLREVLGIDEKADVVKAIEGLNTKITELEKGDGKDTVSLAEFQKVQKELGDVQGELKLRDARETVAAAMQEGKVLPAQGEWATAYALKDPEGFKAYIEKTPKLVDFTEKGGPGDGGEAEVEAKFLAEVNKIMEEKKIDYSAAMRLAEKTDIGQEYLKSREAQGEVK